MYKFIVISTQLCRVRKIADDFLKKCTSLTGAIVLRCVREKTYNQDVWKYRRKRPQDLIDSLTEQTFPTVEFMVPSGNERDNLSVKCCKHHTQKIVWVISSHTAR